MTTGKNLFLSIILLFVMLSTLFFSSSFYDMYQLPKALAVYASIFLSLIILFFIKIKTVTLSQIFLSLYYIYIAIRLILSPNYPAFYYGLLFFSPLLFFIALYSNIKKEIFLNFINCIFFAAVIFAFYQFLYFKIIRPYSFFGNPIFFAEFISVCMPLIIYSLLFNKSMRLLSVINLALLLPSLIMASSRGAVISLFISALLLLFFYFRSGIKIKLNPLFLVITCIIITLPLLLPGFLASAKSNIIRGKSLFSLQNPEIQNRLLLSESAYEIFRDHPLLGAGPGAFKQLQQLKQAELLKTNSNYIFVNSSYAHNDYLQLLSETGIIGAFLFIAFIFILANGFEKASTFIEGSELLYIASLFTGVVFICIESFFNFPLFSFPTSALLFIFAGLIAAQIEPYEKKYELNFVSVKIIVVILMLPLIFYGFFKKPGAIASNVYLKEALKSDFAGNSNTAELYEKALRFENDSFFNSFHYAEYLSLKGRTSDALRMYEKTLFFFPNSADMLYNKASLYLSIGDYNQALSFFEKALIYYPDFAYAHFGLYRTLMALGDEINGSKHLERAVMLDNNIVKNSYPNNVINFMETTFEIPSYK